MIDFRLVIVYLCIKNTTTKNRNEMGTITTNWVQFNDLYLNKEDVNNALKSFPCLREISVLMENFNKSLSNPSTNTYRNLSGEECLRYLQTYAEHHSQLKRNYEYIRQQDMEKNEQIKKIVIAYTHVIQPFPASEYKRNYPFMHNDSVKFKLEHAELLNEEEREHFINYIFEQENCSYRNRLYSKSLYAYSLSFEDNTIKEKENCIHDHDYIKEKIYAGHTSKGKFVLRQEGIKGSHATCMSMLLADRRHKIVHYLPLRENDDLNAKNSFSRIEETHDVKVIVSRIDNLLELEKALANNGPAYFKTYNNADRYIIVDQINTKSVWIREPFHGWSIRVKLTAFLERCGFTHVHKLTIVQVQKSSHPV